MFIFANVVTQLDIRVNSSIYRLVGSQDPAQNQEKAHMTNAIIGYGAAILFLGFCWLLSRP